MESPDSQRVDAQPAPILAAPPANNVVLMRDRHALAPIATEMPTVLSATPNVPGLLMALRRRWRIALFLGLLCGAAAAAGVWFYLPEKFTARTLVLVDANPKPILGNEGRIDYGSFQRTQVAYIKSRLVLNAALNDAKVKKLRIVQEEIEPLAWLEKTIQADFATAPEILRISMTGDEPKDLTAIVDAVRDAYFKEVRSREVGWRDQRLKLLREIYEEADRKLTDKRNVLKGMSEDLGSSKDAKAMERTQEVHLQTLQSLQNELLQTQAKLRKAKMEYEIQKAREAKNSETPPPPSMIEDAVEKSADVQELLRRIAQFESDIDQIKKNAVQPENEPAYKRAAAGRAAADKELNQLRQKLREDLTKKVGTELKKARTNYQDEIAVLESQYRWLDEEFKGRLGSIQSINKTRVNVEWLKDEIKLEDELAARMKSQIEHLQIEMKAPERFTVLEDGYAVPDQDTRIKKAGLAGGGALALILFAVAFLEFRSRRLSNVDDVVRGLRMRFVGALPALRSRRRRASRAARGNDHWHDQLAESIETTRTVLLHAAESESMRMIVVTSAVGGEGKTLTCSHLAASLARAGRKTLLLDADMRRPALQRIFDLKQQPGFSELLRGEVEPAEAIQAGPVEGLSIIAAGQGDDRSIQALSQPVLAQLLKRLRGDFDFVIIDSAPVLPVADTQMICQQADGVVFTVLRHVSRLPQIYAAHERLVALRIRILGAVVNGSDGPVYGSSYPYSRRGSGATAN